MKRMRYVLAIGLLCFSLMGCKILPGFEELMTQEDKRETRETEKAIKNSPELQELDELCRKLPQVNEFRLIGKARNFRKPTKLTFFYYSEKDPYSLDRVFRNYFREKGWETVEKNTMNQTSDFRNEYFTVNIQYGGISLDSNIGISCGKRN
ncbi:MAG: hypothetical protein R2747_19140 [Pyrinomonadaceae bacterium]